MMKTIKDLWTTGQVAKRSAWSSATGSEPAGQLLYILACARVSNRRINNPISCARSRVAIATLEQPVDQRLGAS